MSALEEIAPVRQEDDVIASGRLARLAIAAVAVGLAGVFCAGLLLKTNTGALRPREASLTPPSGTTPLLGEMPSPAATPNPVQATANDRRTIANIEQTPILVARDGLDLRAQQRAELSRLHWLDRDAGIAAIPIDRAMDLVEKESR